MGVTATEKFQQRRLEALGVEAEFIEEIMDLGDLEMTEYVINVTEQDARLLNALKQATALGESCGTDEEEMRKRAIKIEKSVENNRQALRNIVAFHRRKRDIESIH